MKAQRLRIVRMKAKRDRMRRAKAARRKRAIAARRARNRRKSGKRKRRGGRRGSPGGKKGVQYKRIYNRKMRACLVAHGSTVRAGNCRSSKWSYNRLTRRIEKNGGQCMTRHGKSNIRIQRCTGSSTQKFKRHCGVFSTGSGRRLQVLSFRGRQVFLDKYRAQPQQSMAYHEKVSHSKCRNMAHKVMTFDGSPGPTVRMAKMLSFPRRELTVSMWLKPYRGTPFSYSTRRTSNSFVITNPKSLSIWIRGKQYRTGLAMKIGKWQNLAVRWSGRHRRLSVYIDGVKKKSMRTASGNLTPGGCLMLGQKSKGKGCNSRDSKASFHGLLSEVVVNSKKLSGARIRGIANRPVSRAVLKQTRRSGGAKPPRQVRFAYLTRQYAKQEIGQSFPPKCKLRPTPKKLTGPGGWMHWSGTGDVHYSSFGRCKYDDQSVGDWTAVMMKGQWHNSYPLTVQYRTSPQRANCPWCMKVGKHGSAVSYIDGCAIKWKTDVASVGFGGFRYPRSAYKPYATWGGHGMPGRQRGRFWWNKQTGRGCPGGWTCGKHGLRVRVRYSNRKHYGSGHGNFHAYLSDGVHLYCAKGDIRLRVPKKLTGKIGGIAGNGRRSREWITGPNIAKVKSVNRGFKSRPWQRFQSSPNIWGKCSHRYTYPQRNHPMNGNRVSKPVIQWMYSWQVGGPIKPVFGYPKGQGPANFNRAVRPPKGVMSKRPKRSKKKAKHACRMLRSAKKAFAKCLFDYMVLGPKSALRNLKDRMAKRRFNGKKGGYKSVRDLSRYKNDAKWIGHPQWACAAGLATAKSREGKQKHVRHLKIKRAKRARAQRARKLRAVAARKAAGKRQRAASLKRLNQLRKQARRYKKSFKTMKIRYVRLKKMCTRSLKQCSGRAKANFAKMRAASKALKGARASEKRAKSMHKGAEKKRKAADKIRKLKAKRNRAFQAAKAKKSALASKERMAKMKAKMKRDHANALRAHGVRARKAFEKKTKKERKKFAAMARMRAKAHGRSMKAHGKKSRELGLKQGLKRCGTVNGLMREVARLRKKVGKGEEELKEANELQKSDSHRNDDGYDTKA